MLFYPITSVLVNGGIFSHFQRSDSVGRGGPQESDSYKKPLPVLFQLLLGPDLEKYCSKRWFSTLVVSWKHQGARRSSGCLGPPWCWDSGLLGRGLCLGRVLKFPQMSLLCSHGWMYSSKCKGNVVPHGLGK